MLDREAIISLSEKLDEAYPYAIAILGVLLNTSVDDVELLTFFSKNPFIHPNELIDVVPNAIDALIQHHLIVRNVLRQGKYELTEQGDTFTNELRMIEIDEQLQAESEQLMR